MNYMLYLYIFGLLSGALSARTDTALSRAGVAGDSQRFNLILDITGILNGIGFIALAIWGFTEYEWYIALLAFVLAGLASSLLINNRTFTFFAIARPVFSVGCVGIAAYFWFL